MSVAAPALSAPLTVVEPLTASAVPVALAKLMPPNAFKSNEIVVEPVTASAEDVAEVKVAPAKVARPV